MWFIIVEEDGATQPAICGEFASRTTLAWYLRQRNGYLPKQNPHRGSLLFRYSEGCLWARQYTMSDVGRFD
jgi:hypothetical protein